MGEELKLGKNIDDGNQILESLKDLKEEIAGISFEADGKKILIGTKNHLKYLKKYQKGVINAEEEIKKDVYRTLKIIAKRWYKRKNISLEQRNKIVEKLTSKGYNTKTNNIEDIIDSLFKLQKDNASTMLIDGIAGTGTLNFLGLPKDFYLEETNDIVLNSNKVFKEIKKIGFNIKLTKKGNIIGTDYDSKQFINYLQVKYKLGNIIDSVIGKSNQQKLLNLIGGKSFDEINKERLEKEKKDIEKLQNEIENLDKYESEQEFVGYYINKKGQKKYKYIKNGFTPNLKEIKGNTKFKLREGNALQNFNKMMEAYGRNYRLNDAYRDFKTQAKIYDSQLSEYEKTGKKITATKAGTSEHHLGLAVDISNSDYKSKKEIRTWLKIHANEYGFARTYKNIAKDGFNEAWHYRYVGVKMATYLKNHNMGMGEFYSKFSKVLNKDVEK